MQPPPPPHTPAQKESCRAGVPPQGDTWRRRSAGTSAVAYCRGHLQGDDASSAGYSGNKRPKEASVGATGGGGGGCPWEQGDACAIWEVGKGLGRGVWQKSIGMAVHRKRGGGVRPPWTPPPQTKVTIGGKERNHLEERLLDQAQARASYTPLFWGHSRSIPQGMILDVQPLVKSLFCPIRASPNGFFDFEASTP